jgi:Holliday junction resolvase RusA-like endonuclease
MRELFTTDLSIYTYRADDTGPLCFSAKIPVDRHFSKKNNKTIRSRGSANSSQGKRFFISSNTAVESGEKYLVWHLRSRANEFGHSQPITDSLLGVFHFYFPKERFFTKKREVSRNLPDLSNLLELPQDALTKAGIIEDDCQIKAHDGSRILWHDDPRHILVIHLYKYLGKELSWTP